MESYRNPNRIATSCGVCRVSAVIVEATASVCVQQLLISPKNATVWVSMYTGAVTHYAVSSSLNAIAKKQRFFCLVHIGARTYSSAFTCSIWINNNKTITSLFSDQTIFEESSSQFDHELYEWSNANETLQISFDYAKIMWLVLLLFHFGKPNSIQWKDFDIDEKRILRYYRILLSGYENFAQNTNISVLMMS